MNRGEARYYLQSSGFSEEQINTIEQAFKPKPTDDATLRDIFCMGCEYKEQEPCGNAIDRAKAIKVASGYCHPANVAKELAKLPPVNLQPSGDAIDRKLVCAFIDGLISDDGERKKGLEYIRNMPPVTPHPKTGHWIAYEVRLPDRTILNYRCSVCGRKLIGYSTETLSEAPFCHCGARMIEPQERSDKE